MSLRSLIFSIVKAVLKLLPRNKKIWVIGSRYGLRYDESSKALFEYVSKHSGDIRAVWLSRETAVVQYIRSKGNEAYLTSSIKGMWFSLRAGVAVISVNVNDVNRLVLNGAKLVQLWHATPFKKVDVFADGKRYDMVTVAAPEYKEHSLMGDVSLANFQVTGYPRNDVLFNPHTPNPTEDKLRKKYAFQKVALYVPTFRDKNLELRNGVWIEDFDMFEGFDFDLIEKTLRKHDALFIFKLHPAQTFGNEDLGKRVADSPFFHIADMDDPFLNLYDYLRIADLIISDYSGVIFDFLLTGRPQIFFPFDLEDYLTYSALTFPYKEVSPGPVVKSWNELALTMDAVLDGKDEFQDARKKMNDRFNLYQDGNSSRRVYERVRQVYGI